MTFVNASAAITAHAATTQNVHGVGAGNAVVGNDEIDGWLIPTGTILPYGVTAPPTGFLGCDGSEKSRTTYAALFGVIGTSFGVGDGSTTFNVPNMKGKFPIGKGGSGVVNIGDTGGEQTHTLITSEIPAHTHNIYDSGASGSYAEGGDGYGNNSPMPTTPTGGGGAHENMPPYLGIRFLIKT